MSFLREAAVDLIIAMQNHGIPKELEIQFTRLCQECTRSAESETAMLKRKHSCPEWDYMVIDEDSPEFESCLCYMEPEKEWVGLTEDEIQETGQYSYCRGGTSEKLYHIMWNSQPSASVGWCREELIAFAQTIEAKLKEKNT